MTLSHSQLGEIAQNNTIILTNVNCGYSDFALNWAFALMAVGHHNFLCIVEDRPGFAYLAEVLPLKHLVMSPFMHETTGVAEWNTPRFIKYTISRPLYIKAVLAHGFRVLWTDIDSVLRKTPEPLLPDGFDLVLTDNRGGMASYGSSNYCSCFLYFKPVPNSIMFLEDWHSALQVSHVNEDQNDFNVVLRRWRLKQNLSVLVLPSELFANGHVLTVWHADYVVWLHANYRVGKAQKRSYLEYTKSWHIPNNTNLLCS